MIDIFILKLDILLKVFKTMCFQNDFQNATLYLGIATTPPAFIKKSWKFDTPFSYSEPLVYWAVKSMHKIQRALIENPYGCSLANIELGIKGFWEDHN